MYTHTHKHTHTYIYISLNFVTDVILPSRSCQLTFPQKIEELILINYFKTV